MDRSEDKTHVPTADCSSFSLHIQWFRCLREHDCANDRAQEENSHNFELQEVIAEHLDADRVGVPILQNRRGNYRF